MDEAEADTVSTEVDDTATFVAEVFYLYFDQHSFFSYNINCWSGFGYYLQLNGRLGFDTHGLSFFGLCYGIR